MSTIYKWIFTDSNGKRITGDGQEFPGKNLTPGKWTAEVIISSPTRPSVPTKPITVTIFPNADNLDKDTDNDGTSDKNDKCPTIPGSTSNFGCPIIK